MSVAFSADGKMLVSGARDDPARLWEVGTGQEVRRFGKKKELTGTVTVSPDGKTVVAGGEDGAICLWEAATGQPIRQLRPEFVDRVSALAFSPDGKSLATVNNDQGISLWDVSTGKEIGPPGHREGVGSLTWTPDGKVVVSGGGRTVRFWEASSGKELRRLGPEGGLIHAVALSPDGRMLATGGKSVSLWQASTGKELRRLPLPEYRLCCALAFTPDGKFLATNYEDRWIRFHDVSSGKELRRLEGPDYDMGHAYRVLSLAFSADGKFLAASSWNGTGSAGGRLCLWDAGSGKEICRVKHPEINPRLALSADGKLMASSGDDAMTTLWESASGKLLHRFAGPRPGTDVVAFSPDGRLLAAGGRDVFLWELATRKEVRRYQGHTGFVTALAFSADGRRLVSGSADTTALIWDVTGISKADRPAGAKELDTLFDDLGSADAAKGQRAVWSLAAVAELVVPLLQERLRPVPPADQERLDQLVAELDSRDLDVRQRAVQELEKTVDQAESALRKALAGQPSLEYRRRLEALLEKLETDPGPGLLRATRAVAVLEHVGTPGARAFLEKLAKGTPEARLTREAKAALARSAGKP